MMRESGEKKRKKGVCPLSGGGNASGKKKKRDLGQNKTPKVKGPISRPSNERKR